MSLPGARFATFPDHEQDDLQQSQQRVVCPIPDGIVGLKFGFKVVDELELALAFVDEFFEVLGEVT